MLTSKLKLFWLGTILAGLVIGCGTTEGGHDAGTPDGQVDAGGGDRGGCEAMSDISCIEILQGESEFHRWLDDYSTQEFDDDGTTRTVIRLAELIDSEITSEPESFRYQVYGTDGYTFGGYATWDNVLNGFIEIGTRRVVFDPSQELPHSFRVKDSYRMVLSPTGG